MQSKKLIFKLLSTTLLVSAPFIVPAFANTIDMPPEKPGYRPSPPPEFFTACEDKAVGDAVSIRTPSGETIEAVCEQRDDQMVARPLTPPPPPPEEGREQPPEQNQ